MQQTRQRCRRYRAAVAGQVQPMAGDVGEEGLHVLGQDVVATFDKRPGARCREQAQARARAESAGKLGVAATGLEHSLKVIDQGRRDMDTYGRLLQLDERRRADHSSLALEHAAPVFAHQQCTLGLAIGIAQPDTQQEAVELALRQREGADLVCRVLRCDHEEGLGEREGAAVGGDLALLHGLEQRTLRLRGGTVDLVGEDQLGEHRPWMKAERARLAIEHGHAQDVGWQQVAGELDALELQPGEPREDMRERGLAHARNVLDQQVAAGNEAGKGETQLPVLAEDDPACCFEQAIRMVQGHRGAYCEIGLEAVIIDDKEQRSRGQG